MITSGNALTASTLASGDYIGIGDVSAGTGAKITINNLMNAVKQNYTLGQTFTESGILWRVVHIDNTRKEVFLMREYCNFQNATLFYDSLTNDFKKKLKPIYAYPPGTTALESPYVFYLTGHNLGFPLWEPTAPDNVKDQGYYMTLTFDYFKGTVNSDVRNFHLIAYQEDDHSVKTDWFLGSYGKHQNTGYVGKIYVTTSGQIIRDSSYQIKGTRHCVCLNNALFG